VHLKDHPMIKNVEEKIEEFGDKILRMYRENPAAYNALAGVLAIQLGAPFIINAATKAFDIGKTIIF
jgi:hypothetical protein